MEKVSIVTVSYNSAKTIEKTILSVLNQTYSNIEYIVIDGESTDATLDVIKKYKNIISYYISESDQGISDAFNKGIKRATGDFIGIINSDDWYEVEAVERVVQAFQENDQAGFVFGDLKYFDLNGELIFIQKGDANYSNKIRYSMTSIPHPTVFVRRSVYEKHGLFNLQYKTAMDYELLLRFYKAGVKGVYIPHIIANMRIGGESYHNVFRALREVLYAAKKYECSHFYLYSLFIIKCLKTCIRNILQKMGMDGVVLFIKTKINKDIIR